jgi:hypothetical protein
MSRPAPARTSARRFVHGVIAGAAALQLSLAAPALAPLMKARTNAWNNEK